MTEKKKLDARCLRCCDWGEDGCQGDLEHCQRQVELRRELRTLIDRCGCSRASIRLTKEEIESANLKGYITPCEPSCTPNRCFPTLIKLLYPYAGFNKKSSILRKPT